MVKIHFLLENLGISEPSLGIPEKFQYRSAIPNIRYNYAILLYYLLFLRGEMDPSFCLADSDQFAWII